MRERVVVDEPGDVEVTGPHQAGTSAVDLVEGGQRAVVLGERGLNRPCPPSGVARRTEDGVDRQDYAEDVLEHPRERRGTERVTAEVDETVGLGDVDALDAERHFQGFADLFEDAHAASKTVERLELLALALLETRVQLF